MTKPPQTREPATLPQRIRSDIERKILSGQWRSGHRVPFEHELMQQYGCSRMTVNKALTHLAAAGLIVRRRRAGSFVAQPRAQSVVLEIPDIQADIQSRGQTYGLVLLSRRRRRPRKEQTDEQALAKEGDLLALRCLHLANGRPFALEDRLISLVAVPLAAAVDFSVEPPGSWLLAHVPWTRAQHRISALNADREVAGHLKLSPQAACLVLERKTWRDTEPITFVRQIFPGDAYDLIAQFAPTTPRGALDGQNGPQASAPK